MIKFILKIFLVVLLVLAVVLGSLYSFINKGVPIMGDFYKGSENINVPSDIGVDQKNLKIMSFNIRLIAKEEIKEHFWHNRKEPLIELLERYDADIIGFQEVTHSQFKFLIDNLEDEYGFYGIYRSGMDLERGDRIIRREDHSSGLLNRLLNKVVDEASPVFFRKSRFELLDYNTFWLSEDPEKVSRGWDAAIRRICTYVELKDHYTDELITIYNTHFDHRGELAQKNSAGLIYEYIDESKGKPIVMGDFNVPEKGEVYNGIVSRSLEDAKFLSPRENRDNGPTYNGFGNYNKDVPIDFIFINDAAFGSLGYRIIKDKYDKLFYISDHYPVLVELEYK